ncbi:MAG: hypothetical protein EXQ96_10960, partial [Alphaproteobacteria bacterium]|nr:hypothetical protein [Alphaproteobacteria bacterium]
MPTLYVATSKALGAWGAAVGVTKEIYKVGLVDGTGAEAVARLNAETYAGVADWKLIDEQAVEANAEAALLARLGGKETQLSGSYY